MKAHHFEQHLCKYSSKRLQADEKQTFRYCQPQDAALSAPFPLCVHMIQSAMYVTLPARTQSHSADIKNLGVSNAKKD